MQTNSKFRELAEKFVWCNVKRFSDLSHDDQKKLMEYYIDEIKDDGDIYNLLSDLSEHNPTLLKSTLKAILSNKNATSLYLYLEKFRTALTEALFNSYLAEQLHDNYEDIYGHETSKRSETDMRYFYNEESYGEEG